MTVALLDLKPNDCRFPVGDLFCAGARRQNSSYCDHHHGLAYVTAGRRAFSSGGFLADHTEKVAPPRPGRAHEIVRATPAPVTPPLLDQFVRAAAARRHDAPRHVAPASKPRPQARAVFVRGLVTPPSPPETHEGREWLYLANLARQCERVISAIDIRASRGVNYAIDLRDRIAGQLDMTTDELLANRRTKDLVLSRQFAMFCVTKGALKLSLPYIGTNIFGGFDHTTVLHARDKIASMVADGSLPSRLAFILNRICATDPVIAEVVRKARAPQQEILVTDAVAL